MNDAHMNFMFDNRYGTGQSTVRWFHERHESAHRREEPRSGRIWMVRSWNSDGAKGFGANVIVTEVDPVRAIEAKMDGFQVMPMLRRPGYLT